MTLIAAGTGLRKRAQEGYAANAKLEAREIAAAEGLETARNAQQMNTLGTGAGVGAMYGLKKLGAAKAASGAVAPTLSTLGGTSAGTTVTAGQVGAGAGQLGGTIAPVGQTLGGTSAGTLGSAYGGVGGVGVGTTSAGVGTAGAAAAGTGAAATGAGAAGAGASGAGTAGAGTAAAGAGSGALAGLSAVAAPIAIGLGVAYLINNLFD